MTIIGAADLKLRNTLRDAGLRYPRITLAYRWAVRNRIPLVGILAAVRGALDALAPFISDDLPLFAGSGYALITGHFAEVFASSLVQVGPVQLIPFGFLQLLSDRLGIPFGLGLTAPVTVVFTLFAIYVFRRACRWAGREPTAGFELFFGLVVVLGGFSYTVATSAHPAEGFIPLLWILAAIDTRREKPGLAAVWLSLAGAMKLWGVLGAPILLLSPRIRRAALGWAIQVSLTVGAYLPFILTGRVKTFGFLWEVRPQSPLRLFLGSGSAFTWKMRIAQGAFVAGVGALVALRGRSSKSAFWLVPLALVALRYLSDPLDYHYYWVAAGIIVLVGVSTWVTFEPSWQRVPIAAGFYLTIMPFYLMRGSALALWIAAVSIGLLYFVVRTLGPQARARSVGAGVGAEHSQE